MVEEEYFEDEATLGKLAKTGKSGKKSGKPRKKSTKREEGLGTPKTVSFTLAVILIICSFVVGFLVRGIFIPRSTTTFPSGHPEVTPGEVAPPLTPEQMERGVMPPGHPQLEGATPETQTPSETTGTTTTP